MALQALSQAPPQQSRRERGAQPQGISRGGRLGLLGSLDGGQWAGMVGRGPRWHQGCGEVHGLVSKEVVLGREHGQEWPAGQLQCCSAVPRPGWQRPAVSVCPKRVVYHCSHFPRLDSCSRQQKAPWPLVLWGKGCPDVKRLETFQQMSRAGRLAVHPCSSKEGPRSTPHLGWHPRSHGKGGIVMSGGEDFPVYSYDP